MYRRRDSDVINLFATVNRELTYRNRTFNQNSRYIIILLEYFILTFLNLMFLSEQTFLLTRYLCHIIVQAHRTHFADKCHSEDSTRQNSVLIIEARKVETLGSIRKYLTVHDGLILLRMFRLVHVPMKIFRAEIFFLL